MEIVGLNIKGHYFYCPDIEIENYDKHITKDSLLKECAVCKRSIMDASYENITNNSNILLENEITIGKCGHLFHSECINSWTKINPICPIDKIKWHTLRIADSSTKLCLIDDSK